MKTRLTLLSLLGLCTLLFSHSALAISPANPTAQPPKQKQDRTRGKVVCKVADRELQGEFVGNCDEDGYAAGYATISGKASYTGQFKRGQKSGFGIKTWPNGDTYAGQFINDYKEGQGIYRWGKESPTPDDVYIGSFQQDQRWGLGTYHWANGDQYSGEWEADKYMGPPTPMQQLQKKHFEALSDAVKNPGTTVCRNLEPPTSSEATSQVLIGTVQRVNGDLLTIDLISAAVDAQGKPVKTMTDDYRNWTPCDPAALKR
ncbi:MAG: hypothetical protein ACOYBR_04295 [Fluviibacter sp.]